MAKRIVDFVPDFLLLTAGGITVHADLDAE
jgi:hypothetical protein